MPTRKPTTTEIIDFIQTFNPKMQNGEVSFYSDEPALKFKWSERKLRIKPEEFEKVLSESVTDTILHLTQGLAASQALFGIGPAEEQEEEEEERDEVLQEIREELHMAVEDAIDQLTSNFGNKDLPAEVVIQMKL